MKNEELVTVMLPLCVCIDKAISSSKKKPIKFTSRCLTGRDNVDITEGGACLEKGRLDVNLDQRPMKEVAQGEESRMRNPTGGQV